MPLQAPFPYFGGKSKVAAEVWQRFGEVNNYIEPFCGSMAMLLHKDDPTKYETVNDIDGLLTNFWRAIQFAPEEVASVADIAPTEIDLKARNDWLFERKDHITQQMKEDPEYFDAKAAAYWVYVRSTTSGNRGLFSEKINKAPKRGRPKGIHSLSRRGVLSEIFQTFSKRLRPVTVYCGEWQRTITNASLKMAATPTAVFLDPPYQPDGVDTSIYERFSDTIFYEVKDWCVDNGEDPDLRIALCGYEGNKMPPDWYEYEWSTDGGLGKINVEGRGMENRSRERIWFSPHCIDPDAVVTEMGFGDLFG